MATPELITVNTCATKSSWNTPARALHWLAAACLIGATTLSYQHEFIHATLGLTALGVLLIQLIRTRMTPARSPALWLVTAVVLVLDLSGWLAPGSTFHLGATLAALVLASLYFATVLFESLQRLTASAADRVSANNTAVPQ